MRAYYNELDPFAAAWLRELIADGLIMPGDVDDRSITDVVPADLVGYTRCHFFAGIGGWDLALQLAGWPDDRPVWTGSCPCQPFSLIGERKGEADARHLWPVFYRLISECSPASVFGEQVSGPPGLKWLAGVRRDLEGAGYAVGAADLCGACVGSPTRRQRLYWVGDSSGPRLEGHAGDVSHRQEPRWNSPQSDGSVGQTGRLDVEASGVDALPVLRRMDVHDSRGARAGLPVSRHRLLGEEERGPIWSRFDACPCEDGWRRVEPGTFPVAPRLPTHVGLIRAYGNAIIPQVGAAFVTAYLEAISALSGAGRGA